MLATTHCLANPTEVQQDAPATRTLLAFSGAEGYGRFAQKRRGGDVYHVTNINDSNPLFSVFQRLTVAAFRATIGRFVRCPAMLEDMVALGTEIDAENAALTAFGTVQRWVAQIWIPALAFQNLTKVNPFVHVGLKLTVWIGAARQ